MLLAINTCLRRVEVSLIDEGTNEVIGEHSVESNRDHTERIFEFLDDILKSSDGTRITPDKVLVVAGPGPFTSIRVGVVTANTLAYASKAELYSIDLLTLFNQEEKKLPVWISAGKAEIYELKSANEFEKHDAGEWLANQKDPFYGDLNDTHAGKLTGDIWKKRSLSFSEAIVKLVQNDELENHKVREDAHGVMQALPIYLKPPNISKSKKEI